MGLAKNAFERASSPNNIIPRTLTMFDIGRDTEKNFLSSAGVTDVVRYVQTMDGKTMAVMPTASGNILLESKDLVGGLTILTNRGDPSSDYFANALKGLENLTAKDKENLPLIDPQDGGYKVAQTALIKIAQENTLSTPKMATAPVPSSGLG